MNSSLPICMAAVGYPMEKSIGNLPESLIVQCLARMHIKDIPIASRVCRKWLHLVGSRYFYTLRKQLGSTNQVACLLQQAPPIPSFNYLINFFDPVNRDLNRLPPIPNFIEENPIPNFTKELPCSTLIAASEGKLVVFSDSDPKTRDPVKSMFVLDFATQRWRRGKGMPSIRSSKFSAATSLCHRVFISGDIDKEEGAVWEYDAWKDEWIVLHRVRGRQIVGLKVIEEELWVLIGYRDRNWMFRKQSVDAYHLQTEEWRKVEMDPVEMDPVEMAPEGVNELLCPHSNFDIELYELMKNLFENDFPEDNFEVLTKCFRIQLGKQSLLMAPFIMNGGYARQELFYLQGQEGNLERILPSSSEFSGYVESCYCVEF